MNRAEKDASNMEIVFSGAVGDWIRRYKGVGDSLHRICMLRPLRHAVCTTVPYSLHVPSRVLLHLQLVVCI